MYTVHFGNRVWKQLHEGTNKLLQNRHNKGTLETSGDIKYEYGPKISTWQRQNAFPTFSHSNSEQENENMAHGLILQYNKSKVLLLMLQTKL